jgi:hypothetical protein
MMAIGKDISMTNHSDLTPAEARALVNDAERISRRAHDAVRWPYVTFLLALGVATSLGTLGMALTTGRAFGLMYIGTLAVAFALLMFFCVTIQGRRAFAWSRRWSIYIGAWAVTYVGAIAVVAFAHGSVPLAVGASALVLAATLACASTEARR